ncbi:centrosome-associated protein 350-like [Chiloscyllium plagiosum]|uniref:centrosome-associated protein 350-like n=1 Tax=Chiloscyllium plagiosum TaxID=36176 RepID=UPI001CB803C8|nr:centrosome-associated protein 350-like [Chiloscyllium plagiosum]
MAKREASEKIPESKDTRSREGCPVPSCSQPHSDSSIPEQVRFSPAQTLESPSAAPQMSTSPDRSIFTDDVYSQDFEPVATQSKQKLLQSSVILRSGSVHRRTNLKSASLLWTS